MKLPPAPELTPGPTVYLLHFERRVCSSHPARHYLGWTGDVAARIEQHKRGEGARLMEVCRERGIRFRLVRTWPGDRQLERRLKRCKCAPRLCPICRQIAAEKETDQCSC